MSRLTDVDKLNFEGQHYNKSQMKAILDFIDNQPTAYNVEKVARQIEDLKEENFKRGVKENEPALLYASSCLHEALDIVKAGAIDEDR